MQNSKGILRISSKRKLFEQLAIENNKIQKIIQRTSIKERKKDQ